MNNENNGQMEHSITLESNSVPSEAVVRAIAQAKGIDPLEMPTLYEILDPDALDELFKGHTLRYIQFSYDGYDVIVESNGRITIQNRDIDQA